jgi:hypothetical protein
MIAAVGMRDTCACLVSLQRLGLLACQRADATGRVSSGNARGELGRSVEKRLAMLRSVVRERRNACGEVPLGYAQRLVGGPL